MIVRKSIECETCGHIHTVRIGMGNDERQLHKFPCKECGELICIGLEIDFKNITHKVILEENAVPSEKEGDIVNVDANFAVDEQHQSRDSHFGRLKQVHALIEHQHKKIEQLYGEDIFEGLEATEFLSRPRIYFSDEWKMLRKAWSLQRNGRDKLSRRKIDEGTAIIYSYDPLKDLNDWLWRFCMKLGNIRAEEKFRIVMPAVKQASQNDNFPEFLLYFQSELYPRHLEIYNDIFKQYFAGYDAFSQVHLYCSSGLELPDGHVVTSYHFDEVKMFYGNAYEALMTLVELFACLNNLIMGRNYNTFEAMDLAQYKKIDKSGKCNPFSLNTAFIWVSGCVDNQLRNASHHGSFTFNPSNGLIRFRAGKGGTGEEQTISYTDYIVLSQKIFLTITVLLRVELVLTQHLKN